MCNQVIIVFVCHSIETVEEVLKKIPNAHIIFVGDKEVNEAIRKNPNIIIAREQPHHIEHEKKLLTFTAWYLIVKNNLYKEYEYLCVLEYDVNLDKGFEETLNNVAKKNDVDVISFIPQHGNFWLDIDSVVFNKFMDTKKVVDYKQFRSYFQNHIWCSSSNHCMRQSTMADFVDWYYPDCLQIKAEHDSKFPWYHERLFTIYLVDKSIPTTRINGLKHLYQDSHRTFTKD
jgi:hypothetical protein